jgi:hypothetical protein
MPAVQQRLDKLRRPPPPADVDEGAHDGADHVPKEPVAGNFVCDEP